MSTRTDSEDWACAVAAPVCPHRWAPGRLMVPVSAMSDDDCTDRRRDLAPAQRDDALPWSAVAVRLRGSRLGMPPLARGLSTPRSHSKAHRHRIDQASRMVREDEDQPVSPHCGIGLTAPLDIRATRLNTVHQYSQTCDR